jgi:hypothetical protein
VYQSDLSDLWNQEHDTRVLQQAWEVVQGEFEESAWRPVGEILFKKRRACDVAAEVNIPLRTLYDHRRKIMDRMKEFLDGLFDD